MVNRLMMHPVFVVLLFACLTFNFNNKLYAITCVGLDSTSVKGINFSNQKDKKGPFYLVEVHVQLMDDEIVEGRFLKVENDSLYLVNSEVETLYPGNHKEDLIIIPLTRVDTIKKRPREVLVGILLTGFLMYLSTLAYGLAVQNKDKLSEAEFKGEKKTGITLFILGGLAGLITVFTRWPRKLQINGNPSNYKARKVKRFQPYQEDIN